MRCVHCVCGLGSECIVSLPVCAWCGGHSVCVCVAFQMVRMSTGHMEGDLQPLYLLLTDCYIYLLRKGELSWTQADPRRTMIVRFFCPRPTMIGQFFALDSL